MDNDETNFDAIPVAACCFAGGTIDFGDNGDDAKSAPVRLLARSAQPIEHWFWGRVVHDMAGMHLHKPRIALDYVHDPKEVIGFANHINADNEGLVLEGALTPFKESDRATEIIAKAKAGVPYEASINFGGDGIEVEKVDAFETVEVNGFQFDGPGVVIRKWPLRGTAVCPYGADQHTAAEFSSGDTICASIVPKSETLEAEMADQNTEAVDETVSTPEVEAVETTESEDVAELAAPVEDTPVAEVHDPRAEFKALAEEFGTDIASDVYANGGGRDECLTATIDALKSENAELRSRIEAMSADTGTEPVPAGGNPTNPKETFESVFFAKKK